MPHIIIEHSENFSEQKINELMPQIQLIMKNISEGNFDLEQCKARAIRFDEYLVGSLNQEKSIFLHITIKILEGRISDIRKKLSLQVMELSKKFCEDHIFSPTGADQVLAVAEGIADMITGTPNTHSLHNNKADKRCDISVDIVEMNRETYQKFRIEE